MNDPKIFKQILTRAQQVAIFIVTFVFTQIYNSIGSLFRYLTIMDARKTRQGSDLALAQASGSALVQSSVLESRSGNLGTHVTDIATTTSATLDNISSTLNPESKNSSSLVNEKPVSPYSIAPQQMLSLNYKAWCSSLEERGVQNPYNSLNTPETDLADELFDTSVHTTVLAKIAHLRRYSNSFLMKRTMVTPIDPNDHLAAPGNFVDASYIGPKFISASAPVPTNFRNWFKLLHEKVSVIVMVTPFIESGRSKAHRYLDITDQKTPMIYSDYSVLSETIEQTLPTISESKIQTYGITVTKVTIEKRKTFAMEGLTFDKDPRAIYHIHFTCWTDHHIPDSAEFTTLNQTYEKYLDLYAQQYPDLVKSRKPLVHCSAGVGRTGTFIAIQYIIDQLKENRLDTDINIVETVKMMRRCRFGMVQTESQFEFIYEYIRTVISEIH